MKRGFYLIIALLLMISNVRAQVSIDVHSHALSDDYVNFVKAHHAELEEGFPLPTWVVEAQLKFMDEAGIEQSVLTMAAPQPYFGDADESAKVCRQWNEMCASLKQQYPGRFLFCASLPLPHVEKAIEEAKYALDVLHADGVKLATNSRGQYLGTKALDSLMSVLNERDAIIIIHPHKPEPTNKEVMAQTPLAMQEYLSETTRAVSNMITRNVLAHNQRLKVVVPHCGAYLPLAIPRMKSLYPVMYAKGLVGKIDWEANLHALYYDLAGCHSPEIINQMLTITTPDHIMYGSDYPYVSTDVIKAQTQRMSEYLDHDVELHPYKQLFFQDNAKNLFAHTENPFSKPSIHADSMLVRIAEIEVYPEYLDEYLKSSKTVGQISVEREPGVVCIFPMQEKDNPNQIRIIEIYADQQAYASHLKTPHFLSYKTGTLHMVKSLKLEEMQIINPASLSQIFHKAK